MTKTKYEDFREEAEKPLNQRKRMSIGLRGALRTPRTFSLTDNELQEMRKKSASGSFPNPYKRRGIHWAFVQALINLGINKTHSFFAVKKEIAQIMSSLPRGDTNSWEKFRSKTKREGLCQHDENGRIMLCGEVLQRLNGANPYGYKLLQMLSCVDIFLDDKNLPEYKLNTNFSSYNEVRPIRIRKNRKSGKI